MVSAKTDCMFVFWCLKAESVENTTWHGCLVLQPALGPLLAEVLSVQWWSMKFTWLYMNFNIYKCVGRKGGGDRMRSDTEVGWVGLSWVLQVNFSFRMSNQMLCTTAQIRTASAMSLEQQTLIATRSPDLFLLFQLAVHARDELR